MFPYVGTLYILSQILKHACFDSVQRLLGLLLHMALWYFIWIGLPAVANCNLLTYEPSLTSGGENCAPPPPPREAARDPDPEFGKERKWYFWNQRAEGVH